MQKTYTYSIRKREPTESLNGYGYELIIYETGEVYKKSGAFATEIMAKASWGNFIENESFFNITSFTIEQ